MSNLKRSPRLSKESPILLEKLLSSPRDEKSREPNLLASPNAFDWNKRLSMMPGGSPNAFALSLNANESAMANNTANSGSQLYDYPQTSPSALSHSVDLNTMMMMENMVASMHQDLAHNNYNDTNLNVNSNNNEQYSDSPASIAADNSKLFEPLPPKRTFHDRKDSHRESERRRRESFKAAMFHLENLVVLTLNRAGSCKVLGKGPNRKLSHAEIYRMARDIIVTLKEESVKIEHMNQELIQNLQN